MGEALLESFQIYGWKPDEDLSDDDNFVELLLLVTRCSKLQQGSMGCILVRPPRSPQEPLLNRIQSVANNQEFYKPNSSDIHAEVAAIGQAAQQARSTAHCTAYITIPPCRKCFASLYAAGVRRIVTGLRPPEMFARFGDVEILQGRDMDERRRRVQLLVEENQDTVQETEEGSTVVEET